MLDSPWTLQVESGISLFVEISSQSQVRWVRWFCTVFILALVIFECFVGRAAEADSDPGKLPAPATRQVDFATDIEPIFAKTCYECHGPEKQKAGLRLDQKGAALKGGDSGPILVPGKSAASLLIQAIAGLKEDIARMPKKKEPLTTEQIGLLRAWIDQGAVWPETIAANA